MSKIKLPQASTSVLGAAIAKAFAAVDGARLQAAQALRAAFPDQPKGEAGYKRYAEIQESARNGYIAAKSSQEGYDAAKCRKAFATTWSRAMADCGLRPINAKGEVSEQGKGGGRSKGEEKAADKPVESKPATTRDLVTALFGHADDVLIEAVAFAVSHEVLFTAWAKASAAAQPAK